MMGLRKCVAAAALVLVTAVAASGASAAGKGIQQAQAPFGFFGPSIGPKADAIRGLYADRVIVSKRDRKLWLMKDGKPFREYRIALGFDPKGHKVRQGDGRTPEGVYTIDRRNPNSAFHLSLGISYPNRSDQVRAASFGASPGGDIFIHGFPNRYPNMGRDHYKRNWTAGCIALTNREIEEIWGFVRTGTLIEIRP